MKSGPILNGWTVRPRRRSSRASTAVMVVLPAPLWVPATTTAGTGDGAEVSPDEGGADDDADEDGDDGKGAGESEGATRPGIPAVRRNRPARGGFSGASPSGGSGLGRSGTTSRFPAPRPAGSRRR